MIELNEFAIPRREYLKLIAWQTLPLGLMFIALWLSFVAIGIPTFMSLIILFFYLALIGGIFWSICYQYGLSPKNTFLYQKRKISFDTDKIHIHVEDGFETHFLLSYILRVDRTGNYYRLFSLNYHFHFLIPVSAFRSEDDRKRFETEIVQKISPRATLWKWLGICLIILFCVGFFGWSMKMKSNRAGRCCEFQHFIPVEQFADNHHSLSEPQS